MASGAVAADNSSTIEELIKELLWQEGTVSMSFLQQDGPGHKETTEMPAVSATAAAEEAQLLMIGDEMMPWFQYQTQANDDGDGDDIYISTLVQGEQLAAMLPGRRDKGKAVEPTAADSNCRKRDDNGAHSMKLAQIKHGNKRKEARQSASRTHTAEIHSNSEQRRRDKIKERMKILQKLIPSCDKPDKVSMLENAIEYVKTLQLQVQMLLTMQYTGPWMLPDAQRYLPAMCLAGMGMGIATGADIAAAGLQRTGLPFRPILPYGPIIGPASTYFWPPLMPVFTSPNIVYANQLIAQAFNPQHPASNLNMLQIPDVTNSHQYTGLHHHHQVPAQSRAMTGPEIGKEYNIMPSDG